MTPRTFTVLDLGYGDSGKGTITDYLVRKHDAKTVVRFNGGAQAAHNVVLPDGRHHTFSQWGSGTFAGASTHLHGSVVFDPASLIMERAALYGAGVHDLMEKLTVSHVCRVVTPFHYAANRCRELLRERPHGSCGMGIGEVAMLGHDRALTLNVLNFQKPIKDVILARLASIQQNKQESLLKMATKEEILAKCGKHGAMLFSDSIAHTWYEDVSQLMTGVRIVGPEYMKTVLKETAVFEGAQGLLLDETDGFHPFNTWSDCTNRNVVAVLDHYGPEHAGVNDTVVGVIRGYMTRHGPGPLVSEVSAGSHVGWIKGEHNAHGQWQGDFRVGLPDVVAWKYAMGLVRGGVDELAVTCIDRMDGDIVVPVIDRYRMLHSRTELTSLGYLNQQNYNDSSSRELITQGLMSSHGLYTHQVPPGELPAYLAMRLSVKLGVVSRGPTYEDKQPT